MGEQHAVARSDSDLGHAARDLPSALEDLNNDLRHRENQNISEELGRNGSKQHTSMGSKHSRSGSSPAREEGDEIANKQLKHALGNHRMKDNLRDTVFLRAEAIPENQMKAISIAQFVGQSFAVMLLALEVVLKYVWSDKHYLLSKANEWWNTVYGVVSFVAVLSCLIVIVTRVLRYRHKLWGRRRKVLVAFNIFEALTALVLLACLIIANIYVLSQDCTWFAWPVLVCAFIHWSCWNTVFMILVIDARMINFWRRKGKVLSKHGRDRIILDAPIWNHFGLVINWFVFEAVNIALFVLHLSKYEDRFKRIPDRCQRFDYNCKYKSASTALQVTLFASWLIWIGLWCYYIFTGLRDLHQRSWHKYKMANTVMRVQLKARLYSVFVFALCLILLVYVKFGSCANYVQTWLGLGPMAAMEAATVITNMYFFMPKSPDLKEPIIQAMLQEFVWSEDERADRVEQNLARVRALGAEKDTMPLFCFQTAIKSFYFAALIYEFQEDRAAAATDREESDPTVQGYSIEQALELYNLERYEMLVEPAEDTKVLLCWNRDTIHLSFRGTASMTNVLADLQVWMSIHPPKRGRFYTRPKVHAGFLKAWRANGLNKRVMDRLRSIFETPGVNLDDIRVHLTGHSLGGALASLAAIDIAYEFRDILRREDIMCYTFGAPRTGNHSFAKDCNAMVPETWNIMNSRDIIPRSGKFVHKYKAHGQRVIVNRMGDMIVRPTFVEFSASQSLPFQSRVQEHYLATYQASFLAVCTAQFGRKAFKDGCNGLRDLIASGMVHDVLSHNRLDEKIVAKGFGGVTLFQIQNQLFRGVGRIHAGAKEAIVGKPDKERKQAKPDSIQCHDGNSWSQKRDDNLQKVDDTALTRSFKNLQKPGQKPKGESISFPSSNGWPDSMQGREEAQSEAAFQDPDRDPEIGLATPEGLDNCHEDSSLEHMCGADLQAAESSGTDQSDNSRDMESLQQSEHLDKQLQEASLSPGRKVAVELKGEDSRKFDGREQEEGGPSSQPQAGNKRRLHLPHPALPRLLHMRTAQKAPLKQGTQKAVTQEGEVAEKLPSELHFSRHSDHYRKLGTKQRHASQRSHIPAVEEEAADALIEDEESAGEGQGHEDSPPASEGSISDSQLPAGSSSSSSNSRTLSAGSLVSAKSYTLEDNLRRMEKQGTLFDAIEAAEAAKRRKREGEAAPNQAHHGPAPQSNSTRRVFHHSKTDPRTSEHEGHGSDEHRHGRMAHIFHPSRKSSEAKRHRGLDHLSTM